MNQAKPLHVRLFLALAVAAGLLYAILNARTGPAPQPAAVTAPAGTAQVPAASAPALAIRDVSGPLGTVLADERAADGHYTEAWIASAYSSDLQTLISVTGNANGTSPLNINARVFATDASAYLEQNSGGLQPGWQAEYATVRADLNRLAADTGLTPVPAPPDAYGLSAKPDMTLPWQQPPMHNDGSSGATACTAKNTVTDSSSSTGAHSQSVKTTTKCGTGADATSTSHTTKTSVSKTGAVTVTNTNTSG